MLSKKRYLLKLSGEVFKGEKANGISFDFLDAFCLRLSKIILSGVELGIVVGGGNIYRGASSEKHDFNRTVADQIGMLATVMNGLAIVENLKRYRVNAILQSGIDISGVAPLFNRDSIEDAFKSNGCVVFSGGIGNPYFSTDTTAVLRALQIGAQSVFKATKVNGIYEKDPALYPDAKLYKEISFDAIIEKNLSVMDMTSIILLKENNLPLLVFNMNEENILERACRGEIVGSIAK